MHVHVCKKDGSSYYVTRSRQQDIQSSLYHCICLA